MIERVAGAWRTRDSLDRVLILSVVALAYNTHGQLVPLLAFLSLTVAGYLRPGVLRAWSIWGLIALSQAAIQVWRWEGIDDHVIVGTYWALTICLGLAVGQADAVMRRSARWMVGFIFLFAAGWKLLTPEFRSGDFFTLYLLADPRFSLLADVVGDIDPSIFEMNRQAISSVYSLEGELTHARLTFGPALRNLAWMMTYWGIFIESLVALAWLAPLSKRLRPTRDIALLAFCVTTYGLVAITGFAAILLVMAMAVAAPGSVWRRTHAIAFAVISIWTPLWRLLFL